MGASPPRPSSVASRRKLRAAVVAVLLVAASGLATAYAVGRDADGGATSTTAADPGPDSSPDPSPPTFATLDGPRIVFRHTGVDAEYGHVAMVPLDDPGGPRVFTRVICDRVYATETDASCLRGTQVGATSHLDLLELDDHWRVTDVAPLKGTPSRTRLSPDGSLVASTSFVSGHAYRQVGFSTQTLVSRVGGASYGNLEQFTFLVDGKPRRPADRNVWGVTFAADDDTFYATVGTGGVTYLVRGSLTAHTLTAVRRNAECPSLSPDGKRVAYKVDVGHGQKWWTPAVLDLATGRQTLLRGETRNIDDQVEWLDGDTILYGVPRADVAGEDDVWALDTRANATARVLIKDAWSPAVVR